LLDRHMTEFDDFRTQLVNLRDGLSGELRLALGGDVGAGVVLSAVRDFEEAFPGVSVDLATADGAGPLHRREADLAILTNPETDDAIEVVHAQRVALAAWQGAAGTAPAGLWEVVSGRLLLPPEGTGSRAAVAHVLRRNRLETGTVTTLPASQVLQQLGPGARTAIFPETAIEPAADPPRRLPLALGDVQLCVLRAARVPIIRAAQTFLTVLQKRLDAMPPHG
ncbi:LysR substrate-binding domain-containing protein, partial [Roseicyclus sp.]|uniref:LysR substrate-binding domain-containing protein n=1 Tax=Roseicyclus sp. TaxID=1914329 RepID=UPI003F9F18D6